MWCCCISTALRIVHSFTIFVSWLTLSHHTLASWAVWTNTLALCKAAEQNTIFVFWWTTEQYMLNVPLAPSLVQTW